MKNLKYKKDDEIKKEKKDDGELTDLEIPQRR